MKNEIVGNIKQDGQECLQLLSVMKSKIRCLYAEGELLERKGRGVMTISKMQECVYEIVTLHNDLTNVGTDKLIEDILGDDYGTENLH